MRLIRFAIGIGVIVTFLLTIVAYPLLPQEIASHWNTAGLADGFMGKLPGLFFLPAMMAGLVALLLVLPRIDPLKKNYEKFSSYYEGFILVFVLFMLAIQVQTILWNFGYMVSPNLTLPIIFGIFFIYLGFLTEHAEPNWFVGIRTPWTLSSLTVWKKTHAFGGKLFKIAGIISFFGTLAGKYAFLFMIIPVLVVAIYTVVYSFTEFRKEQPALKSM